MKIEGLKAPIFFMKNPSKSSIFHPKNQAPAFPQLISIKLLIA
jgi:hypothetical protein